MAQNGSFAGGEDSRHPTTFDGQRRMTHRVHAGMDKVEAPLLQAVTNRPPAQPELEQLFSGRHPVLAFGKPRDSSLPRRNAISVP